jgi:hypothetical protein
MKYTAKRADRRAYVTSVLWMMLYNICFKRLNGCSFPRTFTARKGRAVRRGAEAAQKETTHLERLRRL